MPENETPRSKLVASLSETLLDLRDRVRKLMQLLA